MLKALKNKKDFRKKLLITLGILAVIQIASGIPTPGVNTAYFRLLLKSNGTLGMLNALSGNGLQSLSITMLSITPYITSSIILQLMCSIIPSLGEIQKDGETGRKKFKMYTVILGAALAAIEAVGFAVGFGQRGLLLSYKWYWVLCVSLIWFVMAIVLMLAGEYIEEKAFGNGISLILLCNILSSYPSDFSSVYTRFLKSKTPKEMALRIAFISICVILLFVFTVVIQETEKRLTVRYSGKLQGCVNNEDSYFPIKLCPGTVVPIILASSIISIPSMVALFWEKSSKYWFVKAMDTSNWFSPAHPSYSVGAVIYFLLIIGFSYFYTQYILNPLEISNQLSRSGGVFPDITPGKATVDYIKSELRWIIGLGALAMCVVAFIPCILSNVFDLSKLSFAGSSIIIITGVFIETKDKFLAEIQSELNHSKISLF